MGDQVSVVIPVYNGADFLRSAIASVYAQTILPGEVIVVNDGSNDATESILRELGGATEPPLRWVSTENRGDASARNLGIAMAGGDFLAFLDHDDVWHPTKLARQLERFAAAPGLALSFTAYVWAEDGSRRPVRHASWDTDPAAVLERLMRTPCVGPPSTVMLRREAFTKVPGFDVTVRVA
jgi:glycosyltransferase involved in cell wall biosynthesis